MTYLTQRQIEEDQNDYVNINEVEEQDSVVELDSEPYCKSDKEHESEYELESNRTSNKINIDTCSYVSNASESASDQKVNMVCDCFHSI